jgi:hypothetical protein
LPVLTLEPLSTFVDSFIKPIVEKLPAFVKDSTDVINKISEQSNLPDIILATFDRERLYTNIAWKSPRCTGILQDLEGEPNLWIFT